MLPDLESLRCFVAAATYPTFRRAAGSVGLSPAALGDRIKRLEADAGVRLFERTTRRVSLTRAGERLVPVARTALATAASFLEAGREDARPAPFELTVGSRFELGLSWLVPSLTELSMARRERVLHLAFADGPNLVDGIRGGTIDAAITSARLSLADIRYAVLHEERYVFVASRALLEEAPLRRAADAGRHVLLDIHRDLPLFRYFLDAASRADPWAFERIEFLGTIAAVRHRVLEGAGVAVLPRYFIAEDLARGRLRRLVPGVRPVSDFFRLVWRAGHSREREITELGEELRRIPLR